LGGGRQVGTFFNQGLRKKMRSIEKKKIFVAIKEISARLSMLLRPALGLLGERLIRRGLSQTESGERKGC
jgi:hypothetical protein